MRFINLTPHNINMNDGSVFSPSGTIARVSTTFSDFDQHGVCQQQYGQVTGLPNPEEGVMFIVSALVLNAVKDRVDLVAPATSHKDTNRSESGQIVSVPGFVRI